MASAKSSNSKVRSMCFFSNSHSGIFFRRSFSSGAFIRSAITGQRVTPENRFAMAKWWLLFLKVERVLRTRYLPQPAGPFSNRIVFGEADPPSEIEDFPQIFRR